MRMFKLQEDVDLTWHLMVYPWHIQGDSVVSHPSPRGDIREAKLFRNNRSQAVRIPAEFEFSGTRVLIHKEGSKLIIEPEPKPNLVETLRALTPLDPDDDFPEDIDTTLTPLRDVEL